MAGTENFKLGSKNNYRTVVVFQFLLILLGLTLSDMLFIVSSERFKILLSSFFLLLGSVYVYFLYSIIVSHSKKRWLRVGSLVVIIGIYFTAVLVENPVIKIIQEQNRAPYLFSIHLSIFMIEVLVISYALKEVFKGKQILEEKLWATAAVYLMIAISFGSIYDLIVILDGNAFGTPLRAGFSSYAESIYFSIKSMVKMDGKYENSISIIHHISIIQSVWSDLFIALLVGNLLSLPSKTPINFKETN